MKIFAGGIATESNTFVSEPTALSDFYIQRGTDIAAGRIAYPSFNLSATWGPQADAMGDELVFSMMAWANPSGVTLRSAYETLRGELLKELAAAMPVDIVLLNLHGAMIAQGYDDCEEDVIRRVRAIVGPLVAIGVELDLHCHLSEKTIASADVVLTYKEYPHTDINARAAELFNLVRATKLGQIKPRMALFDCRVVGNFPTTRQPLRGFVDELIAAEKRDGILSISLAHGFLWADVPHMGSKMLVVSDNNRKLAEDVAREFGMRFRSLRRQISLASISVDQDTALSRALANARGPTVVADQADNPGGGAPGDSTFALRWLLDHGAQDVAIAIMYDPEVVRIAKKCGIGAQVKVRLGGKSGQMSGDPVDIEAEVLAMNSNYQHVFPQDSGEEFFYPAGDVVALRCDGIDILVNNSRCQCFSPSIFWDLGVNPTSKRVLVIKSANHFYSAFAPIAREVIYMICQGAVPPDPRVGVYHRFNPHGVYPWEDGPD